MSSPRKWPVALAVTAAASLVVGLLLVRVARPTDGADKSQAASEVTEPVHEAIVPEIGPSEGEAVDTALELASAPQQWLYLADAELEIAVRAIAAPGSGRRLAEEVISEVALVRGALQRSPGRVWWVVRPLAWRVHAYSAERASVSVWTVSVLSAADVAVPQSDWFTTTFDLRWTSGVWLLAAIRDEPGPTPQLGGRDKPWEPEPLDDALDGFTRVGTEGAS